MTLSPVSCRLPAIGSMAVCVAMLVLSAPRAASAQISLASAVRDGIGCGLDGSDSEVGVLLDYCGSVGSERVRGALGMCLFGLLRVSPPLFDLFASPLHRAQEASAADRSRWTDDLCRCPRQRRDARRGCTRRRAEREEPNRYCVSTAVGEDLNPIRALRLAEFLLDQGNERLDNLVEVVAQTLARFHGPQHISGLVRPALEVVAAVDPSSALSRSDALACVRGVLSAAPSWDSRCGAEPPPEPISQWTLAWLASQASGARCVPLVSDAGAPLDGGADAGGGFDAGVVDAGPIGTSITEHLSAAVCRIGWSLYGRSLGAACLQATPAVGPLPDNVALEHCAAAIELVRSLLQGQVLNDRGTRYVHALCADASIRQRTELGLAYVAMFRQPSRTPIGGPTTSPLTTLRVGRSIDPRALTGRLAPLDQLVAREMEDDPLSLEFWRERTELALCMETDDADVLTPARAWRRTALHLHDLEGAGLAELASAIHEQRLDAPDAALAHAESAARRLATRHPGAAARAHEVRAEILEARGEPAAAAAELARALRLASRAPWGGRRPCALPIPRPGPWMRRLRLRRQRLELELGGSASRAERMARAAIARQSGDNGQRAQELLDAVLLWLAVARAQPARRELATLRRIRQSIEAIEFRRLTPTDAAAQQRAGRRLERAEALQAQAISEVFLRIAELRARRGEPDRAVASLREAVSYREKLFQFASSSGGRILGRVLRAHAVDEARIFGILRPLSRNEGARRLGIALAYQRLGRAFAPLDGQDWLEDRWTDESLRQWLAPRAGATCGPASLSACLARFGLDAMVLYVSYGRPARTLALTLRANGEVDWNMLGPTERLEARVEALRRRASNPNDGWNAAARRVTRALFSRPLRRVHRARRVAVVLDRRLRELPILALEDTRGPWLGRRSVIALPSPTSLEHSPNHLSSHGHIVVFADPALRGARGRLGRTRAARGPDGRFPRLPAARREAHYVAASLPASRAHLFLGEAATEEQLYTVRTAGAVLHLAMHGGSEVAIVDEELPTTGHGYLRMRGSPSRRAVGALYDGFVTAEELTANLDLGQTELVVLSACDTGRTPPEPGRGIDGLRRAILADGAHTVGSSHWAVDDRATEVLMRAFYDGLSEGLPRNEALERAALRVRRRWSHPYYWAAFSLLGRPGPICLQGWSRGPLCERP